LVVVLRVGFFALAAARAANQLILATVRPVLGFDCRKDAPVPIAQALLECIESVLPIVQSGDIPV
jgi:hypothetical protein